MFIYSSVPGFVHLQLSAWVRTKLQSKGIISLFSQQDGPDSELLAPPLVPVPFLQTLCLHPHLSPNVRLAWHRLEKSEGWAFCTFGSRLILVSWLYLFSILLPLYSASTSTAWLVILNRPPTFPLRCPISGLPLGSAGRREKKGRGEVEELPASGCAGCNSSYSALQVNTGRMRVRAETQAYQRPFLTGTSSPGGKTYATWVGRFLLALHPSSCLPQLPMPQLSLRLILRPCSNHQIPHPLIQQKSQLCPQSLSVGVRELEWRGKRVGEGAMSLAASSPPCSFYPDRSYPHLNLEPAQNLRSGVRERPAAQYVTLAEVQPDSFQLNQVPESMQRPA